MSIVSSKYIVGRAMSRQSSVADGDDLKRKRWLILTAGWGFVALGIAGLFLPVLQGILFLLIGLLLLSGEYVWAHNLLTKLRARFPRVAGQFHQASEKARTWLSRTPAD